MKLWVDDHRPAPRGWRVARSVAAAKVYLEQGLVTDISLDHDLGACAECTVARRHIGRMTRRGNTFYNYCPHVPSGYDLCVWMAHTGRWPRGSVRIHSANPAGARRMLAVLERCRRGTVARNGIHQRVSRLLKRGGGTLRRVWAQVGTALAGKRTSTGS